MTAIITLPESYPLVLATACAITFECLVVGFLASKRRNSLFNQEFMNKHFEKIHLKEVK